MSPLINFSGIASGIDTSSLISAILDQRRATQISPLEERIETLTNTNESLTQLSGLLNTLKDAAGAFRALSGGSISKRATSSNELAVSAIASNGAQAGTYTVTVAQLARGSTYSFADRFGAASDVINGSIDNLVSAANRTVTVETGTGSEKETVAIELTNTTTIGDFVSEYNATATKSEASLVNVGTSLSPSYALVFRSKNTGTEKGTVAVSVGSEIQGAGLGAFSTASATTSQALNADFSVTGISGSIERGTNTVNDVVNGVTLNLSAVGTATISVTNDPQATESTISKFVDAYNEIVRYVRENDAITQEREGSETINIFGPLAGSSVDDSVISQLRSALSASSVTGRTVNTLSDLGISTARDGTLQFDEAAFNTAMEKDPEGIRLITEKLGEDLAAVNGRIAQFTQFNGLIGTAINSNLSTISFTEARLSELESSLSKEENSLTAQFARLESLIGRLNSQQSALTSLLPR